ncbi:MAG: hypothetical protein DHS20C17_25980 [Cyclobacteriaceae bacterium]|nr:MAG: hypothetical protein DHS20C17_25980 [Cyclobacteriaceae bacterium]
MLSSVLTILFSAVTFFGSFRKYYPIFIFLVFAFGKTSDFVAFQVGNNSIEFVYIGSLIFFVRALQFAKNNYITKLLLTTYFVYLLYILLRFLTDDLTIIESYKYSRPLIIQINILTAFIYCSRYSITNLLQCAYYASVAYMGYIIFLVLSHNTLVFFHFATFGLAAGYIVSINLFYIDELVEPRFHLLSKFIGYAGMIGVFMGMSRGGMIAIITPFLFMFIFDKTKRTKSMSLFLVVGGVVLLSSYFLNALIPSSYIYEHQGARNLNELFQVTQNLATISTRLLRWEYLINGFIDNPLMGTGFYEANSIFALFRDAWQAHNYFLAILGGGGLLLFIPNIAVTAYPIREFLGKLTSLKSNLNKEVLLGFVIFLEVININFFNTYYYQMWSAVFIWALMGLSLRMLTSGLSSINTSDQDV